MICPYCNYAHGTDWHPVSPDSDETELLNIDGAKGKFYRLPVTMERSHNYNDDRVSMFGCPSCTKVFIEK